MKLPDSTCSLTPCKYGPKSFHAVLGMVEHHSLNVVVLISNGKFEVKKRDVYFPGKGF
jgi:hypothetical protein